MATNVTQNWRNGLHTAHAVPKRIRNIAVQILKYLIAIHVHVFELYTAIPGSYTRATRLSVRNKRA